MHRKAKAFGPASAPICWVYWDGDNLSQDTWLGVLHQGWLFDFTVSFEFEITALKLKSSNLFAGLLTSKHFICCMCWKGKVD